MRDLNAIVHPLVGERMAALAAEAPDDAVVVYDVPLLAESGLADGFDAIVMVLAPRDVRLERLAARGMAADDARARMAAQASDEQRRAIADELIDNYGHPRGPAAKRSTRLWERLTADTPAGRLVWRRLIAHRIESSPVRDAVKIAARTADVAQLVAHHLAKVRVAGSNPVVRSRHRPRRFS